MMQSNLISLPNRSERSGDDAFAVFWGARGFFGQVFTVTDSREKPQPPPGGTSPLVAAVYGRQSEVFRHAREKSTDTQGSPVGVRKPRRDFRLHEYL